MKDFVCLTYSKFFSCGRTHPACNESDHQQVDGQQQRFKVTDRRLREKDETGNIIQQNSWI